MNAPYLQKCSGINKKYISDTDAYDITRRYYASVTEVDALIGELIAEIKKLNLYDDSIIVLWSGDHGYHLGENDHWGKWTNYASSTRVPMLIRSPRHLHAGHRVKGTVECVDMYPTLLELAGLGSPAHDLGGDSLVPFLQNRIYRWRKPAFSVWEETDAEDPMRGVSYSVKTDRYNYILYKNGGELLFDHCKDPKELVNIAKEQQAVRMQLNKVTRAHFSLS
jgi:iduronate 2-sulfatase